MSVLIKGIKMPKCCVDCPCFYDFISCQALPVGDCDFSISEFDEYKERLPNCPLEEVDETKMSTHGRWIKKYRGNYSCSICGSWYTTTDDYGTITDDEIWYNYCPNCGAKMDGDIE